MSDNLENSKLDDLSSATEKNIVASENQLNLATQALAEIEKTEANKKTITPMDMVEHSVADFLEKAISATVASNRLSQALEDNLIESLPTMKTEEKITLFNIERTSSNDRLFKLLSPTFGVITSRQQAEIQAQSKRDSQQSAVQVNIGAGNSVDAAIASKTSAEVETGLNTLFQLISAAQGKLAQKN